MNDQGNLMRMSLQWGVVSAAVLTLLGCAQLKEWGPSGSMAPVLPAPLPMAPSAAASAAADPAADAGRSLRVSELPVPPERAPSKFSTKLASRDEAVKLDESGGVEGTVAAINLQQVPLPTIIQVVYSEILKRNVQLDPAVVNRKDLVTFRAPDQRPIDLDRSMKLLLKQYGVAAIDVGGLVRVVPDNAQLGNMPEIRRGQALPDTPLPLRPVFQLIEMTVVRQNEVTSWLKTLFGNRVTVQEDIGRNALMLSGTPDNVQAALEAISVLDQPLMVGRKSVALSPAYWSAEDLAKRLSEVLVTQGYAVAPMNQLGQQGNIRYPVVLVPVSATNAIYVFAASDEVIKHVTDWAKTLDKPNERGIGKNYFTYQVKHKDASVLAKTLEQLLTGNRLRAGAGAGAATPAGAANGASSTSLGSSVVVDQSTNMLIFQVDADSYSQIAALLQTLDKPAKGALIEVTVAELSVDEKNQMGIEWLFSHDVGGSGKYFSGGTLGGTGIGNSGFNLKLLDTAGRLRGALNALASTNQATILSSPRLLARNGEQATIQVGQEVPIITSQQTTAGTAGATVAQTGVLQTVQYRSTGVILKVKPVIHSGDQIDLEVQQEVSDAQTTNTGVNISPTFGTRKLDTRLTLSNGTTVMIGGLISNSDSKGNAGVPFLKDLPLVGNFFGTQTKGTVRRELVVLITPYILNDSNDAEAMTEAFRNTLGPWARPVAPASSPAPATSK